MKIWKASVSARCLDFAFCLSCVLLPLIDRSTFGNIWISFSEATQATFTENLFCYLI